MSAGLTPELEQMRAALRKFTTQELEPWARVIDETDEVPGDVPKLLARNGYLGMRLDEAFGGGGLGLAPYCLTLEEFSRSHRVFTTVVAASSGNTPLAIARFGTDAQRRKYLRGLADGTTRTAFALTEPEAGSDSAAIKTRAERTAKGWVLNGRKHFISGAHVADFVMVMAVTDPAKRARGGITAFLVERGTPGFAVTRLDTTIGSGAIKLAELTFEGCRLDDAAVLGEVGQGFRIAMESLTEGRLSVACSCIGTADRLLEMSVAHAQARHTFGKPLAERQAIQWMIADSAVELAAARALTYSAILDVEAGADTGSRPSMCKLYCSEMVGRVADRAVQIHGGMGVIRGFPVERFYRDVRHYRIGEGSSEIQRMLIARGLLKSSG
ncbi:MAG: acyl-CoA dehydrogenase family protein [Betaproteobacteria bacterium]|nr:acyl-CoA dehydrogenase family protein [Betaproteobacteria bacterium]